MNNSRIIGALIGLIGAMSNNGKTENTDKIVANALLSEDSDELIELIHQEKFNISPDCRSCKSPCGNTSDYDMSLINNNSEKVQLLKRQIISEITEVVRANDGLPCDEVYRAIAYIGYDLQEGIYEELLRSLRNIVAADK